MSNKKDFPFLSLSDEQLNNIGGSEILLVETKQFLYQLFKTIDEKEEIMDPYGVYVDEYIEDDGYGTYTLWRYPPWEPEDVIRKNRIAAEQDQGEMTADKVETRVRSYFINHTCRLIDRYGAKLETHEELLGYMLRGAMKHYDSNKTLSQNVKQFEFDRAQKKLLKIQKRQPGITPVIWTPYVDHLKCDN